LGRGSALDAPTLRRRRRSGHAGQGETGRTAPGGHENDPGTEEPEGELEDEREVGARVRQRPADTTAPVRGGRGPLTSSERRREEGRARRSARGARSGRGRRRRRAAGPGGFGGRGRRRHERRGRRRTARRRSARGRSARRGRGWRLRRGCRWRRRRGRRPGRDVVAVEWAMALIGTAGIRTRMYAG